MGHGGPATGPRRRLGIGGAGRVRPVGGGRADDHRGELRHDIVDVGHVGQLNVDISASVGWRDAVGRGSGEAIQLKPTGYGTVYVQASEQKI